MSLILREQCRRMHSFLRKLMTSSAKGKFNASYNISGVQIHGCISRMLLYVEQRLLVLLTQLKASSTVDVVFGEQVCLQATCPRSSHAKRTGLLNHVSLTENEGLLLRHVNRVHAYGMCFDIGVAFLDAKNIILHVQDLKRESILAGPPGTTHVLEFHKTKIPSFVAMKGNALRFLCQKSPIELSSGA